MAAGDFVKELGSNSLNATTATSLAITVPVGGVPVGNTVIVTSGGVESATSCTDTQGNTYNVHRQDNSGNKKSGILSGLITTELAEGDTITISFPSNGNTAMLAWEHEGDCSVEDSDTGTNGATTAGIDTADTATLTNSDDLYVGCVGRDGSAAVTLTHTTSGLTDRTKVDNTGGTTRSIHSFHKRLAATTAVDYVGTLSASRTWGCSIVCLLVDSGGGPDGEIDATGLNVPITFGSPEVLPLVEADGLAVAVTFGSPRVGLGLASLVDDFDDNSLDAKWVDDVLGAGSTLDEQNEQIEFAVDALAESRYSWIHSADFYTLVDDEVYCKVTSFPVASGSVQLSLQWRLDASNQYRVTWLNGSWYAEEIVGGVYGNLGNSGASTDAWCRITESGGTVQFWHAPDDGGSPGTWVEIGTGTPAEDFVQSAWAGVFLTATNLYVSATSASIDNFLTAGDPVIEAEGLNVPITFGSPAVDLVETTVDATGLNVPITFGSHTVGNGYIIGAAGLNVSITFGSHELLPFVEANGLNVSITFGSAEAVPLIEATGLSVPITFGSAEVTDDAPSLIHTLTLDLAAGVVVVELSTGVGIPAILDGGKITLEAS